MQSSEFPRCEASLDPEVTMLATLLGINAFDQPGVELGKSLARELEAR